MAILEHEVRSVSDAAVTGLNRRLFSRREYQAMAKAGIFDGQRVELIEGEIIEMAPIGDAHAAVAEPLVDLLKAAFGQGFTVRNQAPIALGSSRKPSEPQPDIAVAAGSWRDYVSRKPRVVEIRLVVEIADSSLKNDRKTKAALYAAAGVAEYWIVNLIDKQLEVHREPTAGVYSSIDYYRPGEFVTPLNATGSVSITDFIP